MLVVCVMFTNINRRAKVAFIVITDDNLHAVTLYIVRYCNEASDLCKMIQSGGDN